MSINTNSPLYAGQQPAMFRGSSTAGILLPALSEPSEASCSRITVAVGPGTVANRSEPSAAVAVSNDVAWPPQAWPDMTRSLRKTIVELA